MKASSPNSTVTVCVGRRQDERHERRQRSGDRPRRHAVRTAAAPSGPASRPSARRICRWCTQRSRYSRAAIHRYGRRAHARRASPARRSSRGRRSCTSRASAPGPVEQLDEQRRGEERRRVHPPLVEAVEDGSGGAPSHVGSDASVSRLGTAASRWRARSERSSPSTWSATPCTVHAGHSVGSRPSRRASRPGEEIARARRARGPGGRATSTGPSDANPSRSVTAARVSGTRCAGSRGSSGGRAAPTSSTANANEMMIGNPNTSEPKK